MFKWIILITGLVVIAMVLVVRWALQDVDDIYRDAGYPKDGRFFQDESPKN